MNKIIIIISLVLLTIRTSSNAQMVLEFQIFEENAQVTLPLWGTVNVSVNWGDGTAIQNFNSPGNKNHTYSTIGTKTVTITGTLTTFGSMGVSTEGNSSRLTKVLSWDGLGITSFAFAFSGRGFLTQVPASLPTTSTVTNMSGMFEGATSFNQPIGNWNTASVTNMSGMFAVSTTFNQPIGNWNTASVTNMSSMFSNASAFNQPIDSWNTTAVEDMSFMFTNASAFNQPIDSWNTVSVTDMSFMFAEASSFNQPIGNWKTASVTDMSGMFSNASAFNQPIDNWNTASVTDMSIMFAGASTFNQTLNNWITSSVKTMFGMFSGATLFNQALGNWNTASVTDMNSMFAGASSFNQALGSLNTAAVKDMSYMFYDASSFNQPLGSWNITKVANMDQMFTGTALCTDNYNDLLNGWAAQTVKAGVVFDAGASKYSADREADRSTLTGKGWTITDAGEGITEDDKCTVSLLNDYSVKNSSATLIYPNPINDRLNVHFGDSGDEIFTYTIFNTQGLLIMEDIAVIREDLHTEIILNSLPSGVYILKLNRKFKAEYHLFVKE